MYNKLFTKILDSSIWLESSPTRIVWVTFIAAMDEHGFAQFASVANVAHRANVPLDEATKAILTLENPDENSSNPANEGRRIERVPGGWIVINAGEHRKMITRAIIQEQTRERVKRFRARKRNSNAEVTPSVAVSETETKAATTTTLAQKAAPVDGEFSEIWKLYPKRSGGNSRSDALRVFSARVREGVPAETLRAGTERYAAYCRAVGKEGTDKVMQACRFYGPGRHWEEDWTVSAQRIGGKPSAGRAEQNVENLQGWLAGKGETNGE